MYCFGQNMKNTEFIQYFVVVTIVKTSYVFKKKLNNLREALVHLLTLSHQV